MIKDESFSRDWNLRIRSKAEYSRAHPELMEKMIYALYLVELLKLNDLNFIFKGGTSLTLMLHNLQRFSIDVDIIVEEEQRVVEEVLTKIIDSSRFIRFELDEQRSFVNDFPKAHYDIYFISNYDDSEKSILLDVLFDKNPYKLIKSVSVESELLSIDGTLTHVSIPSIDDIAADKLTAFAPNTIGIPFNAGKELQIIKQLFDLGSLYDKIDDLGVMSETYNKISEAQCRYNKKFFGVNDILIDTINTAFILAMQNRNKEDSKKKYDELLKGIRSFPSFLPGGRFNMYDATENAAKAALLAAKLSRSNYDPLPKIDYSDYKPSDFPIASGNYQPISKMIRSMPNLSHFYWHHIVNLLR